MVTAAAILMPLGTEPVNSHHVPSGNIDLGKGSFAKSFNEGVVLAGKSMPQVVDNNALPNSEDATNPIPAQKTNIPGVAGTGTQVSVDAGIQGKGSRAESLIVNLSANKVGTVSSVAKVAAAMVAELSQSKGAKESTPHVSADDRSGVSNDALSDGIAEDTNQKLPSALVNALKTDIAEEPVASSIEVAVCAPALLSNDRQTRAALNHMETEITEKTSAVSNKQTAKGADGVGKTTKPANAEKSKKDAARAGNTVEIETQIQLMIPVPGIAGTMESKSSKAIAVKDDVALSLLDSTSTKTGKSNGLIAVVGKSDKVSTGMPQTGAVGEKGAGATATRDPISLKPGAETEKTATQPEASEAGGSVKGQGSISAAFTPVLTPVVSGITGLVSGVVGSTPAVHSISAKSQFDNLSASAGGMQAGAGTLVGSGTLDGGGPIDATHKTLTASPTTLEVGVPNGTHGWLKIRAEMTGTSGVNASLSTASTSGQEMLHRELPSLTAYLESERVAVNTVVIQPAGADFRGFAGGMNGEGQGQAQQSGSQGGENRQDANGTALNRAEDIRAYVGANGFGVDDLLSPASYTGGGSWVSVRA